MTTTRRFLLTLASACAGYVAVAVALLALGTALGDMVGAHASPAWFTRLSDVFGFPMLTLFAASMPPNWGGFLLFNLLNGLTWGTAIATGCNLAIRALRSRVHPKT